MPSVFVPLRGSLRPAATLALLLFCLAAPARGQAPRDRFQQDLFRLRRQQIYEASQQVPLDQRALIDYGIYFTFDYLTVDDNIQNNHVLRQYDTIGYTRLNFDGAHELFLRFRATYRDFAPGDSFDGRGDGWLDPDLDVGYYQFDLARYLSSYRAQAVEGNVVARVGRDIAYWGNGLVLGQVLDGATVDITAGPVAVTALAGVTPVRTVDFDASRPDFDFNTRRGFFGAMASTQMGGHRPFVYALLQQDYNQNEPLVLGGVTTRFGYDSYYLGMGSTGNLGDRIVYGAEIAYEGGRALSNSFEVTGPFLSAVDQTRNSIDAWAGDLRVDYLVPDHRRTRLSTELLLATGDNDRLHTSDTFGGNAPNTSDNAFNGFGLINTGVAFAPAVSNLVMFRAGASTYPFPDVRPLRRLQVGADVFVYGKFDDGAPIDEPTKSQRYLGWEPDIYLNWQISSDVTLALRYGVFVPDSGAFFDDSSREFFSAGVTFAF